MLSDLLVEPILVTEFLFIFTLPTPKFDDINPVFLLDNYILIGILLLFNIIMGTDK
jgi:hypothetical protein